MKFFKHFTDAHEGKSMMALMSKFGVEGYGAFFILTELCAKKMEKNRSEKYSEQHCKFIFNERLIREKLRMRSTKVELFLNYCVTLDLLLFTKVEDELHFSFPKLLESLDRDTVRARPARATAAPKIKNKEKEKEKDIICAEPETSEPHKCVHEDLHVEFIFPFLKKVKPHVQVGWIEAYKDLEFIKQELVKAVTWIHANPAKAPKSQFAKFFSNWLGRAWETRRRSVMVAPGVAKKNSTMGVIGG